MYVLYLSEMFVLYLSEMFVLYLSEMSGTCAWATQTQPIAKYWFASPAFCCAPCSMLRWLCLYSCVQPAYVSLNIAPYSWKAACFIFGKTSSEYTLIVTQGDKHRERHSDVRAFYKDCLMPRHQQAQISVKCHITLRHAWTRISCLWKPIRKPNLCLRHLSRVIHMSLKYLGYFTYTRWVCHSNREGEKLACNAKWGKAIKKDHIKA